MRRGVVLVFVVVAVLVLAAGRDVLSVQDDVVVFRPQAVLENLETYVRGLFDGSSFTHGYWDERSFLSGLDDRIRISLFYITASGLLALVLGPLLGMWLAAGRHDRWRDILTATGAIPDFVLVLLLQIAVVAFYKSTGLRLARVATIDSSRQAILLPLLVLTLVPAVYLVRSVSARTYLVVSEPYVLTAKARGASRGRIYLVQVLPNVTGFLKADLPRVTGIILSSFFIVDYLFNLRGITSMIFQYSLRGGYRYSLVVNGLLLSVALYLVLYALLRAFVAAVEYAAVRA